MQHVDWLILSLFGLLMASVGGFGNHLLLHFRGRTLEAYCRLKGNRERFGKILDDQVDAQTACNYLFVLGSSMALIGGGTWLSARLQWGIPEDKGGKPGFDLPTLFDQYYFSGSVGLSLFLDSQDGGAEQRFAPVVSHVVVLAIDQYCVSSIPCAGTFVSRFGPSAE